MTTFKRKKSDLYLLDCAKIISKLSNNTNLQHEMLKCLKGNIGSTLQYVSVGMDSE